MVKILTLKNRQDFVRAAKGIKVVCPSLIIQAAQTLPNKNQQKTKVFYENNDSSTIVFRLGFTATKKLGKAHIRNKIKRRLRAAARDILPSCGTDGMDYVLVGRYNTKERNFEELKKDLQKGMQKLQKAPVEKG